MRTGPAGINAGRRAPLTRPMRTPTFAAPVASLTAHLERNDKGRDFVVGDIHGHFATLRRALDELEVDEHDRVISLGDLVDRGPDSFAAKDWMTGPEASSRFHLTLRGNHEQMMLEALAHGPPQRRPRRRDNDAWALWMMNGGRWWRPKSQDHSAQAWMNVLGTLPFAAQVQTRSGPVGLVHACPVHAHWHELEDRIRDEGEHGHLTRARALWSRVRHGHIQPEIGEMQDEHLGPVSGVRCVVTGHTR